MINRELSEIKTIVNICQSTVLNLGYSVSNWLLIKEYWCKVPLSIKNRINCKFMFYYRGRKMNSNLEAAIQEALADLGQITTSNINSKGKSSKKKRVR